MRFPRCGGILLHLTSLPSRQGIGDLGQSAYQFAEFLAASGQKLWQVLPLSPTGYGDSPYQCFSAFAGNPLFIDLGALLEQDLLAPLDLSSAPDFPRDYVDYGSVIEFKLAVLRRAAQKFLGDDWHPQRAEFEAFCHNNAAWLNDYALFMACKGVHRGAVWTNWEPAIRRRDAAALNEWTTTLSHHIEVFKYWQFEFCRQWDNLKTHCHQRGIRIMGDIPIYVAHDSADVWAHPELFHLDEQGKPTVVAGVPPDYFSATGQLWGNPIYRWDVLANCGYRWWIDRFRASLHLFDIVRLDHFRGFEAYRTITLANWLPIPADTITTPPSDGGLVPATETVPELLKTCERNANSPEHTWGLKTKPSIGCLFVRSWRPWQTLPSFHCRTCWAWAVKPG